MALTYYIRSWDPRSTYPTNPQEGDICYTITKDQTWAPVGGVKKDNIVKEEIYQSGAWVEQGGGSSKTYYIPEQTAVVSLEEPSPLLTTTDEIYALSNGDEVTVSFNGTEAAATVTVNGLGGKLVEVEIGAYIVSIGLAADSSETTFLNVTDGNYDDVPGTYTVAMYTIEGGGGGGIENALVEFDSVSWTEDGGLYVAEFSLDPIIDPLAVPASLGVIFGDNAYVLPAAGDTPPDDTKFGTWTEAGPSFATYPVAAFLTDNEEQFDTLDVVAEDGSVTKITIFA